MKKNNAKIMRWVAAGLYVLLFKYQVFTTLAILQGANLQMASFVWLAAVLLIPVAGAMAVWMFAAEKGIKPGACRGVALASALAVAFELISYTEQTKIINFFFANYFPAFFDKTAMLYVAMVIRLLLIVLAAFFVLCGKAQESKG